MFARSILFSLGIISLLWIGYASLNIVSIDSKFNPVVLFGKKDTSILISNSSEITNLLGNFQTTKQNRSLIQSLNTKSDYKIYISEQQNQFLLESKNAFSKENITEIFIYAEKLNFTSATTFKIGNYSGELYKNRCYLSIGNFEKNTPSYSEFVYDKNSTGAQLNFEKNGSYSVVDIYLKNDGSIEYKSFFKETLNGKKVNDEALFASVISSRITSYEFYEADYLRVTDPTFQNGPMNNWVKNGIVIVELEGESAIITDYVAGQNPINVLYDLIQKDPENDDNAYFKNIQILDQLKFQGFYIFQLDDYVVISSDRTTCEKIRADYTLGNTIAHSESKRTEIYSKLPKKVNHRISDRSSKQASSIYGHTLLTSTLKLSSAAQTQDQQQIARKGLDIGEAIESFYRINDHQVYVQSITNTIVFYENGLKKWEKKLGANRTFGAELIDLLANDKKQLLIATEKKIHLIDANGNDVSGFPIDLDEHNCTQQPVFYRWQGAGYFIVPSEKGKLIQFDTKGRELAIISSNRSSFKLQPTVWVSANKPYVGVYDGNQFEMIQLLTRKTFRTFEAKNITHTAKLPNEIMLYGIENNKLFAINQKGGKTYYESSGNAQISSIYQQSGNPIIIVLSSSTIHLFNSNGIKWGSIQLPFNEIDEIQLHDLNNGELILSAIDGLENNVYLYTIKGQKWKQKTWNGSGKIVITTSPSKGFKLTTIVDKLLVEYLEN